MMELFSSGGCVSGSDMKPRAAAPGPTLPEPCVDEDEAPAAALAPAPTTTTPA